MLWDNLIALASNYGPFPAGIIIGIYIKHIANLRLFKYIEDEKAAYGEEKKELLALIKAQQDRIDKLHKELYPNKSERSEP